MASDIGLRDILEKTLNEEAAHGWSFVETERFHRATSLFLRLVFRKD